MKKIIAGILVLVILVLGFIFFQNEEKMEITDNETALINTESKNQEEYKEWEDYKESTFNISLKYPSNFKLDHSRFVKQSTEQKGDFIPGLPRGGSLSFYGQEGFLGIDLKNNESSLCLPYDNLVKTENYTLNNKEVILYYTQINGNSRIFTCYTGNKNPDLTYSVFHNYANDGGELFKEFLDYVKIDE